MEGNTEVAQNQYDLSSQNYAQGSKSYYGNKPYRVSFINFRKTTPTTKRTTTKPNPTNRPITISIYVII